MNRNRAIVIFFLLGVILLNPVMSNAHHDKAVLGDATISSQVNFPEVTAGTGFLLPDSPFYFLDEVFQKVRLATAFGAERKAEIHSQIAGERLAELKVMFVKNNKKGIEVALKSLSDESELAATELKSADASGKDVKDLSRKVNDRIKIQKDVIEELEEQSDGALLYKLRMTREELKRSKVQAEDALPEDEIEDEIEDAVEDEIEDVADDAVRSTRGLERSIGTLEKLASQAAMKEQEKRQEALKHAIEVKNEALLKQQEKSIEIQKKKQERIYEEKKKSNEQARELLKKSEEVAKEFEKSKKEIEKIEKSEDEDNSGKKDENSQD